MRKIYEKARSFCAVVVVWSIVFLAFSCEQGMDVPENGNGEPCKLILSIIPQTKATGLNHGIQSEDNIVNKLEIFVFRGDGDDAGYLDTYKKLEGDELISLSGIEIKSTTGKKIIYAIANSHKDSWEGVVTIEDFEKEMAFLQKEKLKDFTMVGNVEATLQLTTSVTFSISRYVARVHLSSVKTDFAGTPYEGTSLKNVKIYLVNVYGDKSYAINENSSSSLVLNRRMAVGQDVNNCAMGGLLYDEIVSDITDTPYATQHYFYCYENMIESEGDAMGYTRLVIQGDLNGNTYYYPININREGFGYSDTNGHYGVKRNTSYKLDVIISRPGSTDPDEILEYGTLTTNLNVLDWVTVPVVQVQF